MLGRRRTAEIRPGQKITVQVTKTGRVITDAGKDVTSAFKAALNAGAKPNVDGASAVSTTRERRQLINARAAARRLPTSPPRPAGGHPANPRSPA